MTTHVITTVLRDRDTKQLRREEKAFETECEAFKFVGEAVMGMSTKKELSTKHGRIYASNLGGVVMNCLINRGQWNGKDNEAIYYRVGIGDEQEAETEEQ